MRKLSAADLLQIWEWGHDRHPIDQALVILSAAFPELSWEALCSLHLGQRDGNLLACREAVFGPRLAGFATCPACGAELEFSIETSSLPQAGPQGKEQRWQHQDLVIQFRYPNSLDLAAMASATQGTETGKDRLVEIARQRLMERIITGIWRANQSLASEGPEPDSIELEAIELGSLTAETSLAFQEYLLQSEPLLEIQLALDCPTCEHTWSALLDIVPFFWREIRIYARRLLAEVDVLARAYGWSEAEILRLSDQRRASYLELALQ